MPKTKAKEPKPKKLRLPKDPEGMNGERAEWADRAIAAFRRATRSDKEDAVCDLIADIAHWCDRNDTDLASEIRRAKLHYSEEAPNGKQFDGLED